MLDRLRAEAAESKASQQEEELATLRLSSQNLTAELANLERQLSLLKQSEEELLLDRTWKLEEMTGLRGRLEAADKEKEQLESEAASLRSLLSDMSAEHESLQQRLAEGQEEVERLRRHQQPPPPDVTAGGPAAAVGAQQQPDVAALRGQHGNPPDLMPGEKTVRNAVLALVPRLSRCHCRRGDAKFKAWLFTRQAWAVGSQLPAGSTALTWGQVESFNSCHMTAREKKRNRMRRYHIFLLVFDITCALIKSEKITIA
jgi:hypothetical protein